MPDASRYARTSGSELINISEVDPAARYARGPYSCLACGHVLVPALGRTRKHHFKHKAGRPVDCLHETYLHQLAKMTLFTALSDAIHLGHPYYLIQYRDSVCDYFEDSFRVTCTNREMPSPQDLTTKFDRVDMEKGIDGFVADILLSSSRTSDQILLEIEVNHSCDDKKLSSGLSIVEIKVRSEADIERLKRGLDATSGSVWCYNQPPLGPVRQRCTTPCKATGLALLLYRNGKLWFTELDLATHEKITSDHYLAASNIIDPKTSYGPRGWPTIRVHLKDFMIRQAFQDGRHVRSCMLCRNNGGRVSDHEIYCDAKDRKEWMSSSAIGCEAYWPADSAEEAEHLFENKVK